MVLAKGSFTGISKGLFKEDRDVDVDVDMDIDSDMAVSGNFGGLVEGRFRVDMMVRTM